MPVNTSAHLMPADLGRAGRPCKALFTTSAHQLSQSRGTADAG